MPPKVQYGSYYPTMNNYNTGDRLRYKCNDGYSMYYDNDWYEYNMCMDTGNWQYKAPGCRRKTGSTTPHILSFLNV